MWNVFHQNTYNAARHSTAVKWHKNNINKAIYLCAALPCAHASLHTYRIWGFFRVQALIASLVWVCSSSRVHSTNTISLQTQRPSPEWPPEEATPLNINAMCLEGFYFKQFVSILCSPRLSPWGKWTSEASCPQNKSGRFLKWCFCLNISSLNFDIFWNEQSRPERKTALWTCKVMKYNCHKVKNVWVHL